jgi:hypothetical protein
MKFYHFVTKMILDMGHDIYLVHEVYICITHHFERRLIHYGEA